MFFFAIWVVVKTKHHYCAEILHSWEARAKCSFCFFESLTTIKPFSDATSDTVSIRFESRLFKQPCFVVFPLRMSIKRIAEQKCPFWPTMVFWELRRLVPSRNHLKSLTQNFPCWSIWSNYSDLTRPGPPKGSLVTGIPLFQGNPGWWNIIISRESYPPQSYPPKE